MNCLQIDELILELLDGPLTAPDRIEVDSHLTSCPACVESLRAWVTTIGLLRDLGRNEESQAAPPLSEALVRRILDARAAAKADASARRTG